MSPANKAGYPLGIQLKETQDERCLANHKKYLRVWDRLEERIEGHFKNQEDIRLGRTMDFQKLQAANAIGAKLNELMQTKQF